MDVVFFLLPIGLLILAIAIAAFCWAVKADQFEDLETPAYLILFDDQELQIKIRKENSHD